MAGANRQLALHYTKKKEYELAVNYLSEYINYRDTIETLYDIPKLTELELLYNNEKAEHETIRLVQDKRNMQKIILLLFFLGLILFILAYSVYRNLLNSKELELQKVQKQAKDYESAYTNYKREMDSKKQELTTLSSCTSEEDIKKQNEKIELLKNDIQILNKKATRLMDALLKGCTIKSDISQTVENDEELSPELWIGIQQKIKEFDPDFIKNLKKVAPGITLRELHLCCLIKLNVPLEQMSVLLRVSKRTLSKYKSDIVKTRFGRQDKPLLDTLL